MRTWVPPKSKQENLEFLKVLGLENEKDENGETLNFMVEPEVITGKIVKGKEKDVEMTNEGVVQSETLRQLDDMLNI